MANSKSFKKLREFSRAISQLPEVQDKDRQKELMQKSGKLRGNSGLVFTANMMYSV